LLDSEQSRDTCVGHPLQVMQPPVNLDYEQQSVNLRIAVYLSGPVTGRSRRDLGAWRRIASRRLEKFADVFDPIIFEFDATAAYTRKELASKELDRLRHGRFIIERNKALIQQCNVVLANFLGCTSHVSIGSVGELFLANALDKPIVVVREQHGNVHDHAMLNALASTICHSLDNGIDAVREIGGLRKQHPGRSRSSASVAHRAG